MIGTYLAGKVRAARRLAEFARYLRNWPEVWAAFRTGRPLPPLRLRGGGEIVGVPDDHLFVLFHEIFVDRCYTRGFYRPAVGDTVVDVGANIGVFAIFLNWLAPGIRVHCFEPMSATRARLEENLARNGVAAAVHPVAVADKVGELTMHFGGTAGHSSLVGTAGFTTGGSEVVPTADLAGALARCGGGRVSLLKIDTEGSEWEILAGATPAVLEPVDRVVVEYHGRIRAGSREFVAKRLRDLGYGRVEDVPDMPDGQLGLIRAAR